MSPRSRKRRTKEENMDIIRATAFKLLEKKGYANLSVNEISDVSGINISQVYRYFPNGKPDILLSVGRDIFESGAPKIDSFTINEPQKFIVSLINFLIEEHRKNKLILQAMKIIFLSYPEMFQKDTELLQLGLSEFTYFEDLVMKLGVTDANKRKRMARFVFHLVDSMIHRHVLEAKVTEKDETLAQSVSNIILNYVRSSKTD